MLAQQVKFYQTGSLVVGNRFLDRSQRTFKPMSTAATRSHRVTAPAKAAARHWPHARVLDAATRATGGTTGRGQRHRMSGGRLHAVP